MRDKEVSKKLQEMERKNITISMEEYKELLVIKGKYEELKSQQNINTYTPIINTRELETSYYKSVPQELTTITCNSDLLEKGKEE